MTPPRPFEQAVVHAPFFSIAGMPFFGARSLVFSGRKMPDQLIEMAAEASFQGFSSVRHDFLRNKFDELAMAYARKY